LCGALFMSGANPPGCPRTSEAGSPRVILPGRIGARWRPRWIRASARPAAAPWNTPRAGTVAAGACGSTVNVRTAGVRLGCSG
jgi:hypothetical protein